MSSDDAIRFVDPFMCASADSNSSPGRKPELDCFTVAVLMLDIELAWTLNARLTRLSSYGKCLKRPILGHSAQATSLRRIEGMTKCWPIARGFDCGSILAFVAGLSRELDLPGSRPSLMVSGLSSPALLKKLWVVSASS